MSRLEVLSTFLQVPKEHFKTRNAIVRKEDINEDENEFILEQNRTPKHYSIYQNDEEIQARINDILQEMHMDIDDLETILYFEGETNGFKIYSI